MYPVEYPNNDYIYPYEQVTYFTHYQNNKPVANIYGFSYETRAVNEDKIPEYNPINTNEIAYHIATLHGSADSPHGHANYEIGRASCRERSVCLDWRREM